MVVQLKGRLRGIVQMLPRQTKRTETGFCASEFVEAVMIVWYRMEWKCVEIEDCLVQKLLEMRSSVGM